MDGNTYSRLLSEMGLNQPSTSTEILQNQDVESVISLLLDDCKLDPQCQTSVAPPVEKSLTAIFVEEKRNYFSQVSSKIKDTKQKFDKISASITSEIEVMTGQLAVFASIRELELKAKLLEIRKEKIAKWDQQLLVCEQAMKLLKSCELESSSIKKSVLSNSIWNDDLTRQLEFVDAGEVKLDTGNYLETLEALQKWGSIVYSSGTDNSSDSPVRSLTPKFIFGGAGEEPGRFCRPWGVCSDATGRILVCDRSNHRIQIFNECGGFLLQFGKEGSKQGEFSRPSGIAVDEKCRIVVADKDNHRIQVFTYSGHYLFHFGCWGTRPGEFMYPWDVAVNKNCDIAVSDSKNHRVQLFNEKGRLLNLFDAKKVGIENPRSALRFMDSPRGLAFTPEGKLLVTDFNNHRILLINESFTKMKTMGSEGTGSRQFFRPQGIACDGKGKFAVADCKNYRIQVFDPLGNVVTTFGTQGTDPGEFDCPQGICFHPNQNIVVVDFNNNRVQVF